MAEIIRIDQRFKARNILSTKNTTHGESPKSLSSPVDLNHYVFDDLPAANRVL